MTEEPHRPTRRLKTQPGAPWRLPAIEDADIYAIQAVSNGIANTGQQQRAYEYICRTLCEIDRMTFWPGAEEGRRASDFAEGKRWVALQLRRIDKLRPVGMNNREEGA